jgi:hypothetical protein
MCRIAIPRGYLNKMYSTYSKEDFKKELNNFIIDVKNDSLILLENQKSWSMD